MPLSSMEGQVLGTFTRLADYWRPTSVAWQAAAMASRAEAVARSITDPYARALAAMAGALAQAGQPEQAEAVARSITDPYARAAMAGALAQADQHMTCD
jgi:hypothetical protein